MMPSERRVGYRIPLKLHANEYVGERLYRAVVTNLSESGLYLSRLLVPLRRGGSTVQLELVLPGTSDSIWARGEVCYDTLDSYFHGTGVRFTGIASAHSRLIRNFVMDMRVMRLRRFLRQMRDRPALLSSPV
jgi:PilZ domain-containing protein